MLLPFANPFSVTLQLELAACNEKRSVAEQQLTKAQADANVAVAELSKLQQSLASKAAALEKAQSKLSRVESDLIAAKATAEEASGAGSSCNLSLKKAESQISEQASRLAELQAVEEALLPVWLSRRLIQAQTFTAEQWEALQQSDFAAQAAAKVAPYYAQAVEHVSPYWEQAMEASKPAREAAAVYYKQAKVRKRRLHYYCMSAVQSRCCYSSGSTLLDSSSLAALLTVFVYD